MSLPYNHLCMTMTFPKTLLSYPKDTDSHINIAFPAVCLLAVYVSSNIEGRANQIRRCEDIKLWAMSAQSWGRHVCD